jgi:hypothetical protein
MWSQTGEMLCGVACVHFDLSSSCVTLSIHIFRVIAALQPLESLCLLTLFGCRNLTEAGFITLSTMYTLQVLDVAGLPYYILTQYFVCLSAASQLYHAVFNQSRYVVSIYLNCTSFAATASVEPERKRIITKYTL